MKNYRAQTPQNLALTKILQKYRKTSTSLTVILGSITRHVHLGNTDCLKTCFINGWLRLKLKHKFKILLWLWFWTYLKNIELLVKWQDFPSKLSWRSIFVLDKLTTRTYDLHSGQCVQFCMIAKVGVLVVNLTKMWHFPDLNCGLQVLSSR